MSRIRGVNTGIEVLMRKELKRRGIRCNTHVMSLPGRPDFVFPRSKVVVFTDGDFWHGYRFPLWKERLPKGYWQSKIEGNRRRDRLNHRKLRREGWVVVRFWGHQVCRDVGSCIDRIATALASSSNVKRDGVHAKKKANAKAMA